MAYSKGIVGTGSIRVQGKSCSQDELLQQAQKLKKELSFVRVRVNEQQELPRLNYRLLTARMVRTRNLGAYA